MCGTCETQQRSCAWDEPSKKRGIQPNYIKSLELTLAWLFSRFPACEEHLAKCLPDVDGPAYKLIGSKDAVAAEDLHQAWRAGIVSKQLEQVLSGAAVDQPTPIQSVQISVPSTQRLDQVVASSNPGVEESACTQPSTAELPDNAWTLLEYYFAYTHSWLPFVGKHELLKAMYSLPTGTRLEDTVAADHTDLFSIFAVAATQIHRGQGGTPPTQLQADARRLLGQQFDQTSSITSYLLHALLDMLDNRHLSAWLHLGTVQRLLSYPHPINKASSSPLGDRYKRVNIAAALLENALAAKLSTVAQFGVAETTQAHFVSEEGDEEWAPWKDPLYNSSPALQKSPVQSCSTFNRLIRMLLSDREPSDDIRTAPMNSASNLVSQLLRNACQPCDRQRPATIVAGFRNTDIHIFPGSGGEPASGQHHESGSASRDQPSQPGFVDTTMLTAPPNIDSSNDHIEPQMSGTDDIGMAQQTDNMAFPVQDNALIDFTSYNDIFCNYTDSQFLRNLGFRTDFNDTDFPE